VEKDAIPVEDGEKEDVEDLSHSAAPYHQALSDKDSVMLHDLEWADWLMQQLWPHMEQMINTLVRENIEPRIDSELDRFGPLAQGLKGCKFKRIELGSQFPSIGPIHAYRRSERDFNGIEIDCDINLDCKPTIELDIGPFVMGIKWLHFSGTASVILKPFVDIAPIVGGMQMFLIDRPTLDFELAGSFEALNTCNILRRVLRDVTLDQICKEVVLPHRINMNILKEWQLNADIVALSYPMAEGMLRLYVKRARNVPGSDYRLQDLALIHEVALGRHRGSTSDPFCRVSLGANTLRTPTIQGTLNPEWAAEGATADFLVHNTKQMIEIELYDDDFGFTANDHLGSASMRVEHIISKGRRRHTVMLESKDGVEHKPAPSVDIEVRYCSLKVPSSVAEFTHFQREHGGPTIGLLGVKCFGLRPIGAKSNLLDADGMIVRVTHMGATSSTTTCARPARIRTSYLALEGVHSQVIKLVRNLRICQPEITDEELAEAAEINVHLVRNILEMNELLPVKVDAGFFFQVEDLKMDTVFIELLQKWGGEHKASHVVMQAEVTVSEIAEAEGMLLKKNIVSKNLSASQESHHEGDKRNSPPAGDTGASPIDESNGRSNEDNSEKIANKTDTGSAAVTSNLRGMFPGMGKDEKTAHVHMTSMKRFEVAMEFQLMAYSCTHAL